MNTETTDTPKIWVACLAAYNNGILHGAWIDTARDLEEVWEDINNVLKSSPEPDAEEWAIHDYDGFFGCFKSEYENIEEICRVANAIVDFENEQTGKGELFAKLYNYDDYKRCIDMMENYYIGCYDSPEDFIYQYLDDTGFFDNASEVMQRYFDHAAFLRDMEYNGEITCIEVNHDYHYFYAN